MCLVLARAVCRLGRHHHRACRFVLRMDFATATVVVASWVMATPLSYPHNQPMRISLLPAERASTFSLAGGLLLSSFSCRPLGNPKNLWGTIRGNSAAIGTKTPSVDPTSELRLHILRCSHQALSLALLSGCKSAVADTQDSPILLNFWYQLNLFESYPSLRSCGP